MLKHTREVGPACPACTAEMVRDAVFAGSRCTGGLRWTCVVCRGRPRIESSRKRERRMIGDGRFRPRNSVGGH